MNSNFKETRKAAQKRLTLATRGHTHARAMRGTPGRATLSGYSAFRNVRFNRCRPTSGCSPSFSGSTP